MPSNPPQPRTITCPTCGKTAPYSPDNPYRPFCSQRCKMIDLGQWANQEYRIPEPVKPMPESED